jgi:hypothetical protein
MLPLLLQHWVASVRYKGFVLYVTLELILEVWFEAEVLQNLQNFQFNFQLALSVMVLSHWFYLLSGLLSLFPGPLADKLHQESTGSGMRRSVLSMRPTRGTKQLDQPCEVTPTDGRIIDILELGDDETTEDYEFSDSGIPDEKKSPDQSVLVWIVGDPVPGEEKTPDQSVVTWSV